MCHENKMGAAKEQHPYINQVDIVGGTGWNRGWNRVEQWNKWNSDPSPIHNYSIASKSPFSRLLFDKK